MYIKELKVQNYKIFKEMQTFNFDKNKNIFIGNNGSGKTCILECIEIITNNSINESNLNYNLKPSLFNKDLINSYENILKEFYLNIDKLLSTDDKSEYLEKLISILEKKESIYLDRITNKDNLCLKKFIESILEEKENKDDLLSKDLEELIEVIGQEKLTILELNNDYLLSHKLIFLIMKAEIFNTPKIIIEGYIGEVEDEFKRYQGGNNTKFENEYGIKTIIYLSEENREDYYDLLIYNRILHIPIYLYSINRSYFNDKRVNKNPFKVGVINNLTHKNGGINKILGKNINSLSSQREKSVVNANYLSKVLEFNTSKGLETINKNLEYIYNQIGRNLEITVKERNGDAWFNELTLYNDEILFESLGYGEKNFINILMGLYYPESNMNILIIEEPENSLSFSNMHMLLSKISTIENIQIFISTHSNYITNRLGLDNVHILNNKYKFNYKKLSSIKSEDKNFFNKLPGYDTLRLLLSKKVVLVEGRSDDLIIQKHYEDKYKRSPIEDGIDIISVEGLSFKRFCRLYDGIDKDIYVVTDNDGRSFETINKNYKEFQNVKVFVEKNKNLKTLEPSILEVNSTNSNDFKNFKKIIYKNNSDYKTKENVLNTMTTRKSEWAYKIFISETKIYYPEYITSLVSELGECNGKK